MNLRPHLPQKYKIVHFMQAAGLANGQLCSQKASQGFANTTTLYMKKLSEVLGQLGKEVKGRFPCTYKLTIFICGVQISAHQFADRKCSKIGKVSYKSIDGIAPVIIVYLPV